MTYAIKTRRVGRSGTYKTPDGPTGKPERPCSKCGRQFFPTIKRRMLCETCFYYAEDVGIEYPVSA